MSTSRNSTPLYEAIRSLVLSARQSAARGVNLLQVYTNYEIGRRIFEQEQQGADRAQYGKELVRELAARLTGEFGTLCACVSFALDVVKMSEVFASFSHGHGDTHSGVIGRRLSIAESGLEPRVISNRKHQ